MKMKTLNHLSVAALEELEMTGTYDTKSTDTGTKQTKTKYTALTSSC